MNGPQCIVETLRTPVLAEYDVVVAGGGASGLVAAVAAARSGARTALVERFGCLGGTGTSGMVAQWIGMFNGEVRVAAGIALELTERVLHSGAAVDSSVTPWPKRAPIRSPSRTSRSTQKS